MEYLATILKERRAALGLTLKQIADAVGVSEATVQRWESGTMNIKYEKVAALAEVLHVDPAALFGWTDAGTKKQPPDAEELSQAQKDLISLVARLPEDVCAAMLIALRQQFPPGDPDAR